MRVGTPAIWHDVECAAYDADLPLWEKMAAAAGGAVLDLGCGSGRVGLHLAARGHRVVGLDRDAALVEAFNRRSRERRLPARAELGDARSFDLGAHFELVLAPMQLLQLFEEEAARLAVLRRAAAHLRPGCAFAAALAEEDDEPQAGIPAAPLPDVLEIDGWVYSSLPVEAISGERAITIRRLRQTVSPDGELAEEMDETRLWRVDPDALEREARSCGLVADSRREIPANERYVGSTVVVLRREA